MDLRKNNPDKDCLVRTVNIAFGYELLSIEMPGRSIDGYKVGILACQIFPRHFERYTPSNQLMLSKARNLRRQISTVLSTFLSSTRFFSQRPRVLKMRFRSSHDILWKVAPLLIQLKIPGNVDRVCIPQLPVVVLTGASLYRFPIQLTSNTSKTSSRTAINMQAFLALWFMSRTRPLICTIDYPVSSPLLQSHTESSG
jgi:hypothetical protein